MDNKTPIQELIRFMKENWTDEEIQKDSYLNSFYKELHWQLPREKKMVEDVWESAKAITHLNTSYDKQENAIEINSSLVDKNKQAFIDNLYPKS